MIGIPATDGERLCGFIMQSVAPHSGWATLEIELAQTGRGLDYVEMFRHLTASHLTCRLMTSGTAISSALSIESGLSVDYDDAVFEERYREYLVNTIGTPVGILDETLRYAARALAATKEKVSKGLKKKLRRQAQQEHPYCYICGAMLEFAKSVPKERSHIAYTLDHVWPRCYGGNSEEANLLPACSSCNNAKKGDAVSWTTPGIQGLVLSPLANEQRLAEIDGPFKFALHYRAAQRLAERKRITLKEAFLEIGPWTEPRFSDEADTGDFFNLANHQPHVLLDG